MGEETVQLFGDMVAHSCRLMDGELAVFGCVEAPTSTVSAGFPTQFSLFNFPFQFSSTVFDKAVTVSTARNEWRRQTMILDLALQAVYKGAGKGNGVLERVRVGTKKDTNVAKMAKMQTRGERTHGRRTERKHGVREKVKGRKQSMLDLW